MSWHRHLVASSVLALLQLVSFCSEVQANDYEAQSFLPPDVIAAVENGKYREPDFDVLGDMLDAMSVLRDDYYAHWVGTWPDGIDWTRAVVGTHVSGTIRGLSEELASVRLDGNDDVADWKLKSNLIDSYFTQLVSYYFGEDAFAIRNEAYDDMLWVVLGWLEAVRFLNTHTDLHYASGSSSQVTTSSGHTIVPNQTTYHGNLWIPAFAHRARVFWDLASKGWDTELCGGGMIWNPRLLPYKNAITNELFIAASISMYLYFPGDDNRSPFSAPPESSSLPPVSGPRDPKYLQAAVDGYRWLAGSNMTDGRGLYADGFHISGYRDRGSNNTRCDEREDTVLTYNQGVLLTGLRGLWDATAAVSYLADGHRLVQNVIAATGWDLAADAPLDLDEDLSSFPSTHSGDGTSHRPRHRPLPRWHGLGRAGVLEDPCDAAAVCNQDATTFKGIYFHHLQAFCAPLTEQPLHPQTDDGSAERERKRETDGKNAFEAAKRSHDTACASYRGWLAHNARAALGTRDRHGKFGQWWTAGLLGWGGTGGGAGGPWPTVADDGVPRDFDENLANHTFWKGPYDSDLVGPTTESARPNDDDGSQEHMAKLPQYDEGTAGQRPLRPDDSPKEERTGRAAMVELRKRRRRTADADAASTPRTETETGTRPPRDPNSRGRGRTVETQTGGLALLRAYWKAQQAAVRVARV